MSDIRLTKPSQASRAVRFTTPSGPGHRCAWYSVPDPQLSQQLSPAIKKAKKQQYLCLQSPPNPDSNMLQENSWEMVEELPGKGTEAGERRKALKDSRGVGTRVWQ